MSIELIGILTVGAALAAMNLATNLATLRSVCARRCAPTSAAYATSCTAYGVSCVAISALSMIGCGLLTTGCGPRNGRRPSWKVFWRVCARRWWYAPARGPALPARRAATAANRRGADRLPGARKISASPLRRATRQRQGRYVIRPTGNSASTINHGMGRHARRDVSSPFQQTITDLAQRDDLAQVRREPA